MRHRMGLACLFAAASNIGLISPALGQQASPSTAPPEVRQIVTFLFQPGRMGDAFAIYDQQLKRIYTDIPALKRFRAYREAESPEPLDLVVVSSYQGMVGMDAANDALRRAQVNGLSALTLYGMLAAMTQTHHDQFVEMIPALSDTATGAALTVFEYLRVAPGGHDRFESLLRTRARGFETMRGLYRWSETGRLLISDGWDYLRIFGVESLGAWHEFQRQARQAPYAADVGTLIAGRKTIVMRNDARLSIR